MNTKLNTLAMQALASATKIGGDEKFATRFQTMLSAMAYFVVATAGGWEKQPKVGFEAAYAGLHVAFDAKLSTVSRSTQFNWLSGVKKIVAELVKKDNRASLAEIQVIASLDLAIAAVSKVAASIEVASKEPAAALTDEQLLERVIVAINKLGDKNKWQDNKAKSESLINSVLASINDPTLLNYMSQKATMRAVELSGPIAPVKPIRKNVKTNVDPLKAAA